MLQLLKHDLSKQLGAGSTNYIYWSKKVLQMDHFQPSFGLPKFHMSAETDQCIVHHIGIPKRKRVSKVIKTHHHSPQLHTHKNLSSSIHLHKNRWSNSHVLFIAPYKSPANLGVTTGLSPSTFKAYGFLASWKFRRLAVSLMALMAIQWTLFGEPKKHGFIIFVTMVSTVGFELFKGCMLGVNEILLKELYVAISIQLQHSR